LVGQDYSWLGMSNIQYLQLWPNNYQLQSSTLATSSPNSLQGTSSKSFLLENSYPIPPSSGA
jgi:hypothetical protein